MQAAETRRFPLPNSESVAARFMRIVKRFQELDERVGIADTLEELTGRRITVVGELGKETFAYPLAKDPPESTRWDLWVDVISAEDLHIFVDKIDPTVPIHSNRQRTVLTYTQQGILQIGSNPAERMRIDFHEEVGEQLDQQHRVRNRIQSILFPQQ